MAEFFVCPTCTKRYTDRSAYEMHISSKHKGYIPKSVHGRGFRMKQSKWPIRIFSGHFEANKRTH